MDVADVAVAIVVVCAVGSVSVLAVWLLRRQTDRPAGGLTKAADSQEALVRELRTIRVNTTVIGVVAVFQAVVLGLLLAGVITIEIHPVP